MIISGVNSPSITGNVQTQSSTSISDTQQKLIEETLAQYDADTLSERDALAIVDAFSAAGIRPGSELESLMSNAGFDAKKVGDLAGVGPNGPEARSINRSEFNDMVDLLSQLIDEALQESDGGQISEEQKQSIYETMAERFGVDTNRSILHQVV